MIEGIDRSPEETELAHQGRVANGFAVPSENRQVVRVVAGWRRVEIWIGAADNDARSREGNAAGEVRVGWSGRGRAKAGRPSKLTWFPSGPLKPGE